MEVRWSPKAFDDFERIIKRIGADNQEAAREVAKTIYDAVISLESFPHRGRIGRMRGRRELVFPSLPYIVVYQVKTNAVEISRIYHSAQDWP